MTVAKCQEIDGVMLFGVDVKVDIAKTTGFVQIKISPIENTLPMMLSQAVVNLWQQFQKMAQLLVAL